MSLFSAEKTHWRRVKFGDVVKLNTERCANPAEAGIERYVGLEHIEPEDLSVRRWGLVSEGTTFTNLFRPGQVLFGKRRAYQRKVAVADFTGVCSGDIYAFESKDASVLLPELLPFVCQTDGFFDHAVGTSAGSLSPRTNWTQLAQYEFALPPLDEQRRIGAILLSLEETINTLYIAQTACDRTIEATIDQMLLRSSLAHEDISSDCSSISISPLTIKLGQALLGVQYGISVAPAESGMYPILRMNNLVDGRVSEEDIRYVDLSPQEHAKYHLKHGDVLFNRTNSYELVGRTGLYDLDGNHVFASYLVRLQVNQSMLHPNFLVTFLNSSRGRSKVMAFATKGVSQTNVNASNLVKVEIPLLSMEEQHTFISNVLQLKTAKNSLDNRWAAAQRFKMRLLEATMNVG